MIAKEYYYLGRWMTPEFPIFIANAPDVYALTKDHSEHYAHWIQNFADEVGYLGDPNHVRMKWEWCQQLGIGADELERYTPLPETIAVTFTMLYYVRRSYEEGLAVFGFAGERLAAKSGYAKTMYEGLKAHYGMDVQNFAVHAYAEPDHGDKAEALFRKVAVTADVQRRCREAIRNTMLLRDARSRALNRLLDEARA
jgi:pyrroloquinoline quinone (PQQ) biosynthesis protein C